MVIANSTVTQCKNILVWFVEGFFGLLSTRLENSHSVIHKKSTIPQNKLIRLCCQRANELRRTNTSGPHNHPAGNNSAIYQFNFSVSDFFDSDAESQIVITFLQEIFSKRLQLRIECSQDMLTSLNKVNLDVWFKVRVNTREVLLDHIV